MDGEDGLDVDAVAVIQVKPRPDIMPRLERAPPADFLREPHFADRPCIAFHSRRELERLLSCPWNVRRNLWISESRPAPARTYLRGAVADP